MAWGRRRWRETAEERARDEDSRKRCSRRHEELERRMAYLEKGATRERIGGKRGGGKSSRHGVVTECERELGARSISECLDRVVEEEV